MTRTGKLLNNVYKTTIPNERPCPQHTVLDRLSCVDRFSFHEDRNYVNLDSASESIVTFSCGGWVNLFQSSLAAASTPLASWNRLLPMVFWLWIQLLMFDLANQTLDRDEDQVNKEWRPLPSGRLSRQTAVILRWLMPFVNLAWSAQYSKEVVLACLGTCVTTCLYNEGGFGDGHWAGRNICNVLVATCLEFGTCLIAGELFDSDDHKHSHIDSLKENPFIHLIKLHSIPSFAVLRSSAQLFRRRISETLTVSLFLFDTQQYSEKHSR